MGQSNRLMGRWVHESMREWVNRSSRVLLHTSSLLLYTFKIPFSCEKSNKSLPREVDNNNRAMGNGPGAIGKRLKEKGERP